MISLEVKDKMELYLKDKYGEAFQVSHIDFNSSSATPNIIYSSTAWPEGHPELAFIILLNRDTEQIEESYLSTCVSYKSREEIQREYEKCTGEKIDYIQQLSVILPYGSTFKKDATLAETFKDNPSKVSLIMSLYINAIESDFDSEKTISGIGSFIENYVKPKGYNYLTLHIWYIKADYFEQYKSNDIMQAPDAPEKEHLLASFIMAEKVLDVDSLVLTKYLQFYKEEE